MKKRIALMLSLCMVGTCLAGCGGSSETSTSAAAGNEKKTETSAAAEAENSIFNETGYPIVNEPITLKVGVKAANSALQGEWEELEWVQKLQEVSGIDLEFVEYEDNNAISLMFASRDYPDISFQLGNDKQIAGAAAAGDLYALDAYMEQYMPNWNKYFTENDVARKTVTGSDGHIYSLPQIREEPQYVSLRDEWYINKSWLDELGLEVPTTTEEFYNVLKAFKENAGKGSIPENVMPYYIYDMTNNVGSGLDMINSFGVRVSQQDQYVTVDDNGNVEFNFADESIKEPMEYFHKLVDEGLLSKDSFTDDWSTFVLKTQSEDCAIGSFHAYSCVNPDYVAMGPLDSGNGKTPMIRSQPSKAVMRNKFTVYKNCQYPEIAVRLADMIADPDWSMQGMYGMYGDLYLSKADDGTRTMLAAGGGENYAKYSCPHGRLATLTTYEMFEKFEYEEGSQNYGRAKDFEEIYKDYVIPSENIYPSFAFTDVNVDRISELNTDVMTHVKATLSTWALEGGIEEGWDDYIAQLEALGMEEYLTLLQEELDAFNAR